MKKKSCKITGHRGRETLAGDRADNKVKDKADKVDKADNNRVDKVDNKAGKEDVWITTGETTADGRAVVIADATTKVRNSLVQKKWNTPSTLLCLINVLGLMTILQGKCLKINKRPGLNNCPGRIFTQLSDMITFLKIFLLTEN